MLESRNFNKHRGKDTADPCIKLQQIHWPLNAVFNRVTCQWLYSPVASETVQGTYIHLLACTVVSPMVSGTPACQNCKTLILTHPLFAILVMPADVMLTLMQINRLRLQLNLARSGECLQQSVAVILPGLTAQGTVNQRTEFARE